MATSMGHLQRQRKTHVNAWRPDGSQSWGLTPQAMSLQVANYVEAPPPSKARQPDSVTQQEGNG